MNQGRVQSEGQGRTGPRPSDSLRNRADEPTVSVVADPKDQPKIRKVHDAVNLKLKELKLRKQAGCLLRHRRALGYKGLLLPRRAHLARGNRDMINQRLEEAFHDLS